MKETHIAILKNFIFDKKPLSQDEFYVLRKDLEDLIKLNYTEQNISKSLEDVIIGISNLYSSEAHKKFMSNPEFIFQLGAFYALTSILDSDLSKKNDLDILNSLANKIAHNDVLFAILETIKLNPAIKKSEVEEMFYETGKIGYGKFLNIYVELKRNMFILTRIGVRDEYLYMTQLGDKLYDTAKAMKEENEF